MTVIDQSELRHIQDAVTARSGILKDPHDAAVRLFNGFTEGCPGLVIDLFAKTVVIMNQSNPPARLESLLLLVSNWITEIYPWVQAVLVKTRHTNDDRLRRGIIVQGGSLDTHVCEHGVRYALDLTINQDASFYLDTRNLREWLRNKMHLKSVLNTFAYTGSLGAAAMASGASRVVQLDLSPRFLDLGRQTFNLNKYPVRDPDFIVGDFFRQISHLKRQGSVFDCVILDPPFFSVTDDGRVDLVGEIKRLINKVRPLVAHNGWLVTVNNALFVSGEDYLASLKTLSKDGYIQVEGIIPVPLDVTGYPETILNPNYPADPAPFNHSTKIAVLRVTRKDQLATPPDK